jgi:hypothetical protein
MRRLGAAALVVVVCGAGVSAQPASPLVTEYCAGCHKENGKPAGGLTLAGFDASAPEKNAQVAEKVIRKLRAGMMPPPGSPRPPAETIAVFVEGLEARLDAAAAVSPDPGWRPFQRLNRAEYARAIFDLVGLEIDPAPLLPPDTVSAGFDNIADVQTFSATLMTGYLRGASRISRLAIADPASRKRIFVCTPSRPGRIEDACAATIVKSIAARAFRGQGTADDVKDAIGFYTRGRQAGTFDDGIRFALQSILVSPRFVFRLELVPSHGPGAYAVDDRALASRLSFFLWGAGPDDALLKAAASGALRTPAGLEAHTRRMLADARSSALATRFAAQWLRLQDLEKIVPDPELFPHYDRALANAMTGETERFFESVIREDRSVMDLFTADYSFVNDRLARHYGIPNITGAAFQRVIVPEERRGLLGQASILASTSVADRTSPVLRGKWVMEVLLGTPPSPPPPNVPALDDSVKAIQGGKPLSTRQRIEEHRKNPSCSACHRFIDPLGLSLENFDVTGAWRTTDNGVPVDAVGDLYDGTKMNGPGGLRQALVSHQDMVLRNFADNLMTYAVGRRTQYTDMPALRTIVGRAAAQGNRFSAFVLGVVHSAAFRMAKPEVAVESHHVPDA